MKVMAGLFSQAGRWASIVRHWTGVCAQVATSPRFASAVLVSIVAWEFVVLIFKASSRSFWYDELFTFHVSSLRPFSLLLRALQAGTDGMPPGYYVFVQFARMFPGDPHVTLRLPSIFGYILSLSGVYLFARKRLPVSAGLMAVVFIILSPFRTYALEARPYALLVGFFAISAVLWQRIDEKRFMTPLFALFLTVAVSSHHLGVLAISTFGIAELTWTILSRRIRWGVWTACLLASSPFVLGLPFLLRFRDVFAKNFWSRPSWSTAVSTYVDYLGLYPKFTLVLMVFLGIVVGDSLLRMLRRPGVGSTERDFRPHELVLIGGFLFYAAMLVVLTKLLSSSYTPRYGWPAILGLALGLVYVFRTIWPRAASAQLLVALLIAFAVQGGYDLRLLFKAGSTGADERWTKLAELSRDEPCVPVVIGSGMTFLEATEYAPRELRGRLVNVVDANIAVSLTGSDSVDNANRLLAHFIPLRVEDLAPFQAAHEKFLLYSGGPFDWLTQNLVERRYHLRLLSKDADGSIYMAER